MEKEDVIDEKQENNKKKPNAFISGISKVGKLISDKYKSTMDAREAKKQARELEENIKNAFNSRKTCQSFDCVSDDKKPFVIVGDMNYEKMTITLLGEDGRIHKNCAFVDRTGQVFKIELIQLNQNVQITLNDEVFNRDATIIKLMKESNDGEKEKVRAVVNNTNINIIDSTIKKSDIGGR